MQYGKWKPVLLLPLVMALAMAVSGQGVPAQVDATAAPEGAIETRTGFLIPSQCQPAAGVKPEPKGATDAWPAPHTTDCALQPACIESGYGLWVVDSFYRLDDAGQEKALAYFRTTKRTSYNKVELTGDYRDPDKVRVESIVLTD